MNPEKMTQLRRLVKLIATVDAFPGRRGEVLARLRVDEAVYVRDSQAFGSAFAALDTHQRAELAELHRLQTAAMRREGFRVEDLGSLPVDGIFATRVEAPKLFAQADTDSIDSMRIVAPPTPFAGQTSPERLAVIRAAHPADEDTASEHGDTVLAPRPVLRSPLPWAKTEPPAAGGDGTADPDDETLLARRPGTLQGRR